MDKIVMYVNNMFSRLPHTEAAAKIKMQLIDNMTEKYEHLVESGKNEHEALGIVVADFGSIEEICNELGFLDSMPVSESGSNIDQEELRALRQEFKAFQLPFGIAIGIGVLLCISSLVLSSIVPPSYSAVAFFIPSALGVFVFIIFGIKYSHLSEEIQRSSAHSCVSNDGKCEKKEVLSSRLSSSIMLSATIIFLLLGFLKSLWHPGWVVFPIAALLIAIINVWIEK